MCCRGYQTSKATLASACLTLRTFVWLGKGCKMPGSEGSRTGSSGREEAMPRGRLWLSWYVRAALRLPLTLLCLSLCSVGFLGLLAAVALWLLLWLCIPHSGDRSESLEEPSESHQCHSPGS